jgi:glycosyltransferase involved in cell wall biosynthesis
VRRELQARAGSNVEFVGHLADEDVVSLMQRCAASVFPSRDDFGLVPVETMACGRPVLAFAEGGALETVVPGVTGELFANGAAEGLRDALIRFEPDRYDPETIRLHALRWDLPVFELAIREAVSALARASVADLEPQRNPMLLDPLQLLPDPERV